MTKPSSSKPAQANSASAPARLKSVFAGPEKVPHVLFVVDQLWQLGGGERVLLEIVRRMDRNRFRCSVLTLQPDPAPEVLKHIPCQLHILPLRRAYDLRALKMGLRLRRLIRDENVSIVHTFFETSDLWAGPIAKLSGVPITISSRRDMGFLRRGKHRVAYPIASRFFDYVLAVSDEVRSYCIQTDHIPARRVETLYNGVDLEEISAKADERDIRRELGLSPGVPVVATVANIRPVKGLDVLVRAAAKVCREFPEAVFLIVGDVLVPETYSELQALVESLNLKNNVRFVGKLANPYPVLQASDVFCLPSRNEGFSNALIEAMGCGLPCVATRVGGNAEALLEGTTGYLVESEDDEAMAERLLRLLRNPELALKMGAAARERAENQFSIQAMVSRLMKIYEELLAEKNA